MAAAKSRVLRRGHEETGLSAGHAAEVVYRTRWSADHDRRRAIDNVFGEANDGADGYPQVSLGQGHRDRRTLLSSYSNPVEPGTSVLLDNTTVHGAIAALNEWPPSRTAWTIHPYAANLRSLMDIIEAIILFETVSLDSACRTLASPAYDESIVPYANNWKPFRTLRDRSTGEHIFALETFSIQAEVVTASILATAAEKLKKGIADGVIEREAELFSSGQIGLAVPEFYTNPREFIEMLRMSVSGESFEAAEPEVRELERLLRGQSASLASFAMFAFRGYYYDELAHLLSMSYLPHSFRAGVLAHDVTAARVSFAKLTVNSIGSLRQEYISQLGPQLSLQLNSELAVPSLTADFPLIASYVAGQATSRSDLIRITLEIRDSAAARRFRQWVLRVQAAIDEQARLQVIRNAAQELADLCRDLRHELRIPGDRHTQVTVKMAVPGGLAGVEVPVTIRSGLPSWLTRILHRRPHLAFLRDLALSGIEFAPFAVSYQALTS